MQLHWMKEDHTLHLQRSISPSFRSGLVWIWEKEERIKFIFFLFFVNVAESQAETIKRGRSSLFCLTERKFAALLYGTGTGTGNFFSSFFLLFCHFFEEGNCKRMEKTAESTTHHTKAQLGGRGR